MTHGLSCHYTQTGNPWDEHIIEMQGEYTRLPVRNERYDRDGRNRATNRR